MIGSFKQMDKKRQAFDAKQPATEYKQPFFSITIPGHFWKHTLWCDARHELSGVRKLHDGICRLGSAAICHTISLGQKGGVAGASIGHGLFFGVFIVASKSDGDG